MKDEDCPVNRQALVVMRLTYADLLSANCLVLYGNGYNIAAFGALDFNPTNCIRRYIK